MVVAELLLGVAYRSNTQSLTFERIVSPAKIHDFLLHRYFVGRYKATGQFFQREPEAGH